MGLTFSKAFIKGYSKALTLNGSTRSNFALLNGQESDVKALREDWINVGKAIKEATNKATTTGQRP